MNLFEDLAHVVHIPWVYLSAIFAALVLMMAGLTVRRATAGENGVLPDEGVSIRNVVEFGPGTGVFTEGILGKLADPIVTRMYARDVRSNLAKLKELLEG